MALTAVLSACGSSPSEDLFSHGPAATGGSSFIGAGGATSFAGSNFGGSGGVSNPDGSGGVPGESGGIANFGGASSGGAPLTGGFGGTGATPSGGANAVDAGATGGRISGDASVDSRPDAPRPCPAGHYAGTLSGPYTTVLGTSQFVARIDFNVESSGAVSGTLTGTSDTTSKATLDGTVDCATGDISIAIVKGTYRSVLTTTAYSGTMTATFDPTTSSFPNGHWQITEPNSSGTGEGTWSARQ